LWSDGIILNDLTPLMVVDVRDSTSIDTVFASRSIWALKPDTAVRIWIATNTDPINHVAYSQLSIDRGTGTVYVFWMKLDEWRGDTTGYGSWDIWYSYSTDNGYSWSEPVNLTNTIGVDEAMFQVAKRVVNGRTWLAFLRPMGNRVIDLYWQVWTGFAGGVWPAYVYVARTDELRVSEDDDVNTHYPASVSIQGQNIIFIAEKPDVLLVNLYDVTGRLLSTARYTLQTGKNILLLPQSTHTHGIYFVNLKTPEGNINLKLFR